MTLLSKGVGEGFRPHEEHQLKLRQITVKRFPSPPPQTFSIGGMSAVRKLHAFLLFMHVETPSLRREFADVFPNVVIMLTIVNQTPSKKGCSLWASTTNDNTDLHVQSDSIHFPLNGHRRVPDMNISHLSRLPS